MFSQKRLLPTYDRVAERGHVAKLLHAVVEMKLCCYS